MSPYSLIELIAGSHELALRIALLVLSHTKEGLPDPQSFRSIVNISVGEYPPIDAYVDLVEWSALLALLDELNAGRVQFSNIDIDGRPSSLIGRVDGIDRLRIYVDARPTLRVAVLTV
ncbi:hypothetical protein JQ621_18040 [Bradyrhizobium manausense]|jgi:hypothetical protein|uniref:hypothetical protein n=1 Tax=Bradyrhizobium manausense TaxID=989370 RepID=UPI001BA6F7C7|nr:hypothetical protein [Bradyrhizobium manausense]MBR1089367.1 hypothetical protein [Bradyrhizobium manausense]